MKNIYLLILVLLSSLNTALGQNLPTKRDIARSIQSRFNGYKSEMSQISLINYQGKKIEDSKDFSLYINFEKTKMQAFINVTEPSEIRGSQFWVDRNKEATQLWIKIKGGSVREVTGVKGDHFFLGSEFSISHLSPVLLNLEEFSEPEIREIESVKHLSLVQQLTSTEKYSHSVIYLDLEVLTPQRIEYYLNERKLLELTFDDYQSIDGFLLPKSIAISNLVTKRRSMLKWSEREVNIKFADALFLPK